MAVKAPIEKEGGAIVNETVEKISATLDEAMLLTGFGLYNIYHMLLNGFILLGLIAQCLTLGYVLPAAKCDLDLTQQQIGIIAAIPFMAIIIMSYFWGYLGDTCGRRPVMLYSMTASASISIIASFAPNAIIFAALQFFSAIFTTGTSAVVYTYLGEFNNLRHRDKMVTFGSSFVGIATVVLPGISWLILPLDFAYPISFLGITYRPWRLLVVACTLPYIISSCLIYFSPESPKFLHAMAKDEECLAAVKKIYKVNKFKTEDSFPVNKLISEDPGRVPAEASSKKGVKAVLVSMKEQTVPLFKSPLLPWTCLCCFVQFGIFATTNGFFVWFPTMLNSIANHEGENTRICNILQSSASAANTTDSTECNDAINVLTFERSIYVGLIFYSMYIVVIILLDFVGKKVLLVTILIITGIAGVGAHLVPNQNAGVVLFAIFQMSGACIGLMNAVAVALFPTKYRAMAICLSMMMGRLGSMIGSYLIGFLITTHCGVGFYLFGGIIIMNGLFCLIVPGQKSNGKEKKTVEPTQFQTHEPA